QATTTRDGQVDHGQGEDGSGDSALHEEPSLRRAPIVNRSSPGSYRDPTRRGKYGGESRKPIRGSPTVLWRAIASAAPIAWTGTKPSWRAATSSRQPPTRTEPSRSSAGRQPSQ